MCTILQKNYYILIAVKLNRGLIHLKFELHKFLLKNDAKQKERFNVAWHFYCAYIPTYTGNKVSEVQILVPQSLVIVLSNSLIGCLATDRANLWAAHNNY